LIRHMEGKPGLEMFEYRMLQVYLHLMGRSGNSLGKIKENEMGNASSIHEKCIQNVSRKT
jgi:hypothetical protein